MFGGYATAQTVQTIGAGSAVLAVDRSATFDLLDTAHNGTPLSDYAENGMIIGVDGDSWSGDGYTDFDPFHGANGADRSFECPYGGSLGWVTIERTDSGTIHAVEFMYGNGWTTGDIYGPYPWGNDMAIVTWQTRRNGALVSTGVIGDAPLLEMGTIVGFYDPTGFDQLLVKCTIASSGDPTLQALVVDNLNVQSGAIPRHGDPNCDGVLNFNDINPFVLALSDPNGYQQQYPGCTILSADCNGDGVVNFDDINPFVALLSGGQ
jgi:hypothetical protein